MHKPMKKAERELEREEALKILQSAAYGTLATIGENGYPYTVVLNHVVVDGKICFHCAPDGAKISNINQNPKVCFSAVGEVEVLPSSFATAYESAVAFGQAKKAKPEREAKILLALIEKFAPEYLEKGAAYINRAAERVAVYEIEIDHLTGKKCPKPEKQEHKK